MFFQHDCIYKHTFLWINYTTYDVRHDQDIVNPRTSKCDIMVLSNKDKQTKTHPFWYAQVLGMFHTQVVCSTPSGQTLPLRMEFLWVRWFGRDPTHQSGWRLKCLDRVGFVPHTDAEAFGFLDPKAVVRAAHLIPAFVHGWTYSLCLPSVAQDDEGDWKYYYVNRCVQSHHTIHTLSHLQMGWLCVMTWRKVTFPTPTPGPPRGPQLRSDAYSSPIPIIRSQVPHLYDPSLLCFWMSDSPLISRSIFPFTFPLWVLLHIALLVIPCLSISNAR